MQLIDRHDFKNHLYRAQAEAFKRGEWYVAGAIKSFIDLLDKQPTIEPEVRHGRWIFVGEETMHDGWTYRKHKCSECGFLTVEAINFCPKCGARMDAEDINVFTKDGMTNGDKIRVMDDEELVEFLMNADANICDFCDMKYPENCLPHSCEGEDCKTEILKWLKQEVKADDER